MPDVSNRTRVFDFPDELPKVLAEPGREGTESARCRVPAFVGATSLAGLPRWTLVLVSSFSGSYRFFAAAGSGGSFNWLLRTRESLPAAALSF